MVKRVVIIYDNSAIEPYTNIGAWINSKMSERNPQLYCTIITLTAMQGHQTKKKKDTISLNYSSIWYTASRIAVAGVQLNFIWCGVGKTNHDDEPYIKLVIVVFLRTDSSRTVRLLTTASGDVNRSVLVAHGWPVNYMGGC